VKEVCFKLHVSRETLRRWERDTWFPKWVRFTQYARGRVAFLKSGVDSWIEARQTASQMTRRRTLNPVEAKAEPRLPQRGSFFVDVSPTRLLQFDANVHWGKCHAVPARSVFPVDRVLHDGKNLPGVSLPPAPAHVDWLVAGDHLGFCDHRRLQRRQAYRPARQCDESTTGSG
jgi:predicted DNA-binding transcriptional regulator AlpA